jgi:gas vesicle protein
MSDNRTDALMAFLFGAAVGAGVALLMAPSTGEETRKKLTDAARRLSDDAQDKLSSVKDEVRSRAGDVRTAINAGKEAYRNVRSEEPAPTSTAM